jgi:8-oxo-dGTP pyrophosphatase MutT (NUDIX family)
MRFSDLLTRIQTAFRAPLPGPAAQALMAPRPRRAVIGPVPLRDAAALVLLFPIDAVAYVLLTVRHEGLGRHGGQVSLPGGAVDPGETLEAAALREAQEEVGLRAHGLQLLGALSPVDIAVSGFRLHPIVAALDRRPPLSPARGEVERILEVPVEGLADPAAMVLVPYQRGPVMVDAPAFRLEGVEIWGATAMTLAELLAMVGLTIVPPE